MKHLEKKYWKVFLNLGIALAVLLGIIFLLPKVLRLFAPFITGWLIASIANPFVHFFESKLKVKRKAGSAIVIIGVIAGILALGYAVLSMLAKEIYSLLLELPGMWQSMMRDVQEISGRLPIMGGLFPDSALSHVQNFGSSIDALLQEVIAVAGGPTVDAVGNLAQNIPSAIIGIIMCLLSSYFFVAERDKVVAYLKKKVPGHMQEKWWVLRDSIFGAVGGYFKAQFKIEVWIYLFMLVGFWILKIEYGYLIAFLLSVLDFFPVFGTGAVLIPWAIVKFLSADYMVALGLLLIWGVGQLLRHLIQPKYVGDSIGMPIIPTLILLYLGYRAIGVVGMIVAVPIGIVVQRMYETGFFDTTIRSLKILWNGINRFRRLTPEDMAGIEKKEKRDEQEPEL